MLDRTDQIYFEARLRQERAIAATCEDNAVALAHLRMADEYERRLAELRRAPQVQMQLQTT